MCNLGYKQSLKKQSDYLSNESKYKERSTVFENKSNQDTNLLGIPINIVKTIMKPKI